MADTIMRDLTTVAGPHYEPLGWHHWPEDPWMSFQFRRALGETQPGGGTVSECFQAAASVDPTDPESWYAAWRTVADRNRGKAVEADENGFVRTARAAWLRASNYYRSAEFWLDSHDPRKLDVFDQCETAFRNAGRYFDPPLEVVEVPYENGVGLDAYFLRSPASDEERQPTVISFGGLDSFKEELYLMVGRGVLERGMSCLLVDGPGQGSTVRRKGISTRFDYEVPVAACIDYLETRHDVDSQRLALTGTSIGGYYAARAASFEHRLAAVVSHGGSWDLHEVFGEADASHPMAHHLRAVFGAETVDDVAELTKPFKLDGILGGIQCPYLIIHGGQAVFGTEMAEKAYTHAHSKGVDVELRLIDAVETGADHCQHDNPTVALEHIGDWLADRLLVDQRALDGQLL